MYRQTRLSSVVGALLTPLLFVAGALPLNAQQGQLEALTGLLGTAARETVPRPLGWVSDFADAFEPREEAQMDGLAREVLYRAGVELCVVTVRRLKLGSAQSYSSKLAEHWGLGRRSGNRCLLLLAVMEREEVTLYVGYKLRSVVTDRVAAKLVAGDILPLFRQGRFGPAMYRGAYQAASMVFAEKRLALSAPPPVPAAPDLREVAMQMALRHRRPLGAGVLLLALWIVGSKAMAVKRHLDQRRREAQLRARRFVRGAGCFSPRGAAY
jgi:uncharacterized protein